MQECARGFLETCFFRVTTVTLSPRAGPSQAMRHLLQRSPVPVPLAPPRAAVLLPSLQATAPERAGTFQTSPPTTGVFGRATGGLQVDQAAYSFPEGSKK